MLLDPYRPGALGGRLTHGCIQEPADVVAVTHFHEDHGWIGGVPGDPIVVDRTRTARGVRFRTTTVPHDGSDGSHMGLSRRVAFTLDGVAVLHPGDLGRVPDDLTDLGRVDLLLVPVGGKYTIGPAEAAALVRSLAPRWVVPMHYRSPKVDLDMATREDFVAALGPDVRVTAPGGSDLECREREGATEVVLLDPSL